MSVYRPKYKDPKTGETKTSPYWSYEFIFAGRRIREAVKTTRKTVAIEAEKRKRLDMERAYAGMPHGDSAARRVTSVADALKAYQEGYKVGHRPRSLAWLAERAVHVTRLLGPALVPEVNEDRVRRATCPDLFRSDDALDRFDDRADFLLRDNHLIREDA